MNDVIVEWRGDAIWIRLNRPDRRNAFDPPMADAVVAALEDAPRARAVVITGSGGSFCAGGALTTLSEPTVGAMRALYANSLRMFDADPRPARARSSRRSTAPRPAAATNWSSPATWRWPHVRRRSGRPARGSAARR